MKKLIYQARKIIIISFLPYVFIISAAIIHVDYDVTSPGQLNVVESVISIEQSFPQKGSFNTVSVYVNERTSLLSYLLAQLNPLIVTNKAPKSINLSKEESKTSGRIQKIISINNALIAGYHEANKEIEYEHIGIIIHTVTTDLAKGLELGDIIINWDGKKITEVINPNDFQVTKQNNYEATVIRNKEQIKIEVIPKIDKLGIYYYHYYQISHANPSYQILESSTIGPSGGLMQALAIYNAITERDITNGLKIAGTGTIDINGQVGPIGGIYQKVFTSYLSNADVFFVPVVRENGKIIDEEGNNYHEALRAYQKLKKPKMAFVPVQSLSEAIKYLENRSNR